MSDDEFRGFKPAPRRAANAGNASELASQIDALMAQPIKSRPAVLVFGDDDVHGFTPAAPPHAR